jgi:hypothetical protein
MDGTISSPFFFSAGAVAGFVLQQLIDVWKTRAAHRHELQRRFFEVKLQTAIDLAQALDALVASHQARLVEATERTRDDENFGAVPASRKLVELHTKALEKDYERYMAALALLELVFAPSVATAVTEGGVGLELTNAWREFDDSWEELTAALTTLIPDARMEALREQRRSGQYDDGAGDEMISWMTTYKAGNAKLRMLLPRLASLTQRAEEHRRSVLFAVRTEMKPYYV